MQYLVQRKVWAMGTLNKKRSRKCPIKSAKALKAKWRGFSEELVSGDKKVVVISWFDNKSVLTMSNYCGRTPATQCKRWDRKKKEYVSIDRPASVTVCNKLMGGVDKSDMMLALYRTKFKSLKWYQRLATHLFSQACVNAWAIHRSLHPNVATSQTYIEFLLNICRCLLGNLRSADSDDEDLLFQTQPKERRVTSKDVPMSLRYDRYDHWPILCELKNAERCKMDNCKGKTMFKCSKCKLYLCVTKGDCFVAFHDPEMRE